MFGNESEIIRPKAPAASGQEMQLLNALMAAGSGGGGTVTNQMLQEYLTALTRLKTMSQQAQDIYNNAETGAISPQDEATLKAQRDYDVQSYVKSLQPSMDTLLRDTISNLAGRGVLSSSTAEGGLRQIGSDLLSNVGSYTAGANSRMMTNRLGLPASKMNLLTSGAGFAAAPYDFAASPLTKITLPTWQALYGGRMGTPALLKPGQEGIGPSLMQGLGTGAAFALMA